MTYNLEGINTLFAEIAECMHRNPARAMRLAGKAKEKVRVALERAAAAHRPQVDCQQRAGEVPDRDAVDLARCGMELHSPGMPEYIVCAELVRVAEARAALAAKPAASAEPEQYKTDDEIGYVLAAIQHYGSQKWAEGKGLASTDLLNVRVAWDDVYARVQALAAHKPDGGDAEDAERWRWATALDDNAETLHSIVISYGGDQAKINERADAYRNAAISAQQRQGAATAHDGEAGNA